MGNSLTPKVFSYPLLFLLLGVLFVGILTMPAEIYPADPFAWREEARSIILHGTLRVDTATANEFGKRGQFFVVNPVDGNCYSKYGIMNSILNIIPMSIEYLVTGSLPEDPSHARLVILNYYGVILSLIIAFLMFRVVQIYTSNEWICVTYVLLSFYTTFLWNYLRAHNSEPFQLLFSLLFFLSALKLKNEIPPFKGWSKRYWILCWAALFSLVLLKLFFILFLFPLGLLTLAQSIHMKQTFKNAIRHLLKYVGLPAVALLGVVGLINQAKFGSPFATGYHQWNPEWGTLGGSFFAGAYGFLLNQQFSIFTHFPLLIFSIFGLKHFYSKYRFDFLVIYLSFLVFFICLCKNPNWSGQYCYGPRYLVFILPLTGLPLIFVMEKYLQESRKFVNQIIAVFLLLTCSYSMFLQLQINRLPFFFRYIVHPTDGYPNQNEIDDYFFNTHFALINWSYIKNRDHLSQAEGVRRIVKYLTPKSKMEYEIMVLSNLDRGNYFWFR